MKYILRFVSIFIIVFITTSCTNILNISQENINVINKEDIEIIKECVEKKKDVYELGYLTLDLDVSY
jgi:lipoprotein